MLRLVLVEKYDISDDFVSNFNFGKTFFQKDSHPPLENTHSPTILYKVVFKSQYVV